MCRGYSSGRLNQATGHLYVFTMIKNKSIYAAGGWCILLVMIQCSPPRKQEVALIDSCLQVIKSGQVCTADIVNTFMYKTEDSDYVKLQSALIPPFLKDLSHNSLTRIDIVPYDNWLPDSRGSLTGA